jgi:serine/threonine protein phosphatase PrpC
MRHERELEIEQEFIAADDAAPRRDAATLCAARHPDVNEDRVLCDPVEGVAAVFDGIGGQAGGELAARAACGAMAMALNHLPQRDDVDGRRRWLAGAVESGHAAISLSKRLHGDFDSRAYRVHDGQLELIADEHEDTVPRPAMADALDRVASAEDFEGAPKDLPWAFTYRNIVSAELGSDVVKQTDREPHVAPGDLILLVSDGVHDNLAHQEIEAVLADCAGRPPQALASALVARAHGRSQERGHLRSKDDDVTCAVLQAS